MQTIAYLYTQLNMDDGEQVMTVLPAGDYSRDVLLFFENGKCARLALDTYKTKTNRKKLLNAYSDKSPLAALVCIAEDVDVAVTSTEGRSTQGVGIMNLKPKYKVATAAPLSETSIKNKTRYRVRSLPAAGALLRDEDRGEQQLSLMEE